jgi:FMN-dependent NADH-azoreductase
MHNFGIASVLKSWIDNIVRAGKTFRYNDLGVAVGIMPKKKIYIVVSTGGIYSAGPMAHFDHAATYLEDIFRFLGMEDITVIRAEGMAMGPGGAELGIANATAQIELAA